MLTDAALAISFKVSLSSRSEVKQEKLCITTCNIPQPAMVLLSAKANAHVAS